MAGRLSPSIDSHEPQQQHGLENCLVLRPTKEEFSVPFCEYVRKVFKKHPDLPMFKVVPPPGWKARNSPFPDLRKVSINVPIRQHVFGTKGAYRCVFVEEKSMSVYDFRKKAEEEAVKVRKGHHGGAASTGGKEDKEEGASSGHVVRQHRACCASSHTEVAAPQEDDVQLERAFWSGVTLNPPLYGADTPHSFFDDKLKWGWNLRNLGDMLRDARVADIPGVTTPMTYFGMWRSFFGWHKEDADLYSTNYLHFGAPKMWYCVAPSDKDKFERMAQGLFPELHKACPAFVRHKDILLSPSLLKMYNVPYIMAKQNVGEFMVLNAASYHAGFNCGFNCAEAVNFAMKEWIPVGKDARPCKCMALKDGVRIDMRLFDPKWVDPYASDDSEDDSEDDSSDAGSEHSHSEDEGSGSAEAGDDSDEAEEEEEEEQEEEEEETPKKKSRSGTRKSGSAKKPAASPAAAKKAAAAAASKAKASAGGGSKKRERAAEGEAESAKDSKRRRTSSSSEGAAGGAKKAAAKPKAKPIPKGKVLPSRAALAHHLSQCALGRSMVSSLTPNLMSRRAMAAQVDEVQGDPLAVLAYDKQRNQRVFFLVQRLKRPAALPGHVALRWLKQGPDGLHRPVNGTVWEDLPGTLLPVRTQHVAGGVRRASGWRLLDSDASIVSHLLVASKA